MSSKAAPTTKPNETAATEKASNGTSSSTTNPSVLEEDDEFEDFPVEGEFPPMLLVALLFHFFLPEFSMLLARAPPNFKPHRESSVYSLFNENVILYQVESESGNDSSTTVTATNDPIANAFLESLALDDSPYANDPSPAAEQQQEEVNQQGDVTAAASSHCPNTPELRELTLTSDWPEEDTVGYAEKQKKKAAAVAAGDTAATTAGTTEGEDAANEDVNAHLWEESWDDDDTNDDFSQMLKEEIAKVEAGKK